MPVCRQLARFLLYFPKSAAVVFLLSWCSIFDLPSSQAQEMEALRTVESIRLLTPERALQKRPVQIEGVVTYYDWEWQSFFLQDKTGGVYIQLADSTTIPLGARVKVEGVTGEGDFASIVHASEIQIVGEEPLPAPREIPLERLASGEHDSVRVELEGTIRSLTNFNGRIYIDLARGSSRAKVLIPENGNQTPTDHLLGARIRVQGICAVLFKRTRELAGFQLLAPSLDHIVEIHPEPNPFNSRTRPISGLLRSPQRSIYGRVKIKGVVTHQQLGRSLHIQDETGAIYVQTRQTTPVELGDEVEVAGYIMLRDFAPGMQDAIFQIVGQGIMPDPVPVTSEQMERGQYDAQLVRTSAKLLQILPQASGLSLVCGRGTQRPFEAFLEDPGAKEQLRSLREGSELELTGICSFPQGDSSSAPFQFLLRSPADIVVTRASSWWTASRFQQALVMISLITAAVIIWMMLLRHRLRLQSAELRKQLQQEAALEERFRALFERANDIIFTHDPEGHFTSLNRSGERITGYSREEFSRLTLLQILAPESRPPLSRRSDGKIDFATGKSYELEIISKEGKRLILEVNSQIHFENGKAVDVQSIARDVTERKQTQRELEQARERLKTHAEELEKRVEERTRALAKTVESLESFCYSMAHDLRAPLRTMHGFSLALLEDYGSQLDSAARDYAHRIMDGAGRMDRLIEDLLGFARLSHQDLWFGTVDLNRHLEAVLDELKPELLAKNADIQVAGPLPFVRANPAAVQQVFSNLLGNALKFVDQGTPPKIRVWAVEGNDSVRFYIHDNGIGIDQPHQARIFQLFERLHPFQAYSGTGIGLAIVQKAVERMDGKVGLESKLGEGSCFWIELPKAPSSEPLPAHSEAGAHSTAAAE